jgi:late competence protein required for DNA uptake (superfamily II DNA/RNA helicase)
VQPVCTLCHAARDSARARQTHCKRGHEFTPENTIVARNGTRHCRECRKIYDRNRTDRNAAYWRNYRASRKEVSSNG